MEVFKNHCCLFIDLLVSIFLISSSAILIKSMFLFGFSWDFLFIVVFLGFCLGGNFCYGVFESGDYLDRAKGIKENVLLMFILFIAFFSIFLVYSYPYFIETGEASFNGSFWITCFSFYFSFLSLFVPGGIYAGLELDFWEKFEFRLGSFLTTMAIPLISFDLYFRIPTLIYDSLSPSMILGALISACFAVVSVSYKKETFGVKQMFLLVGTYVCLLICLYLYSFFVLIPRGFEHLEKYEIEEALVIANNLNVCTPFSPEGHFIKALVFQHKSINTEDLSEREKHIKAFRKSSQKALKLSFHPFGNKKEVLNEHFYSLWRLFVFHRTDGDKMKNYLEKIVPGAEESEEYSY